MPSIHIVVALDENYWHRANEFNLFESIHHNTKNDREIFVECLCFGFDIPESDKYFKHQRWSWARCEVKELQSYREGFPKGQTNRPFYVCAEGGEFLDYFKYNPEDIIVHIDADMVMQRPFHSWELEQIKSFKYGQVGGSFHSFPATPLSEEADKLRPQFEINHIKKLYPNHWDKPIFCAGLVVATAQTYRDVIYYHYLSEIDQMIKVFDHHAMGQWLMNFVVYEHGNFVNLGHLFHLASWFIGMNTQTKDIKGKLSYKGTVALFNHHKFQRKWDFR